MNFKRIKRFSLYFIFGVFITSLFLYLRFPADIFKDYITDRIKGFYPNAALSIGDLQLDFPPAIVINKLYLKPTPHSSSINVEKIRLSPDPGKLFQGKSTLLFDGRTFGGRFNGELNSDQFFDVTRPQTAEIKFENINAETIEQIKEVLGHQITGRLKGKLTFQNKGKTLVEGGGRLDFTLLNGSYPLLYSALGIDKLDFTSIEGQLDLADRNIKLSKLSLNGDKIRCTLNGDIIIDANVFTNSKLNLTGVIELRALNNKRVPLSITGTLANPVTKPG